MKKALLALGFLLPLTMGAFLPASAQTAGQAVTGFNLPQGSTYNGYTCPATFVHPCFVQYGSSLPVSGTFSASLAGFHGTAGATANLSVSNVSSNVALPAGTDLVITNTGSNTAFIRLTTGAGTAVTTDWALVAGAAVGYHISGETFINAITSSSTTTLNIQGGSGLATGYGGGSGGGSSSNASVSATGSAVPASGTYAAMNVSGNLTGLTGTANGLKVDGSAVTQPVSAASLPLPAGAATATNQTNTQGTVAAGTVASNSMLTGCVYNSTEPSPTTGQGLANQCDSKGRQRQVLMDAAGNTRGANVTAANALVVDNSAVTQPISASTLPLPTGAATSANQTNTQGSASGGAAASTATLVGGIYNTSAPTLTNGQQASLQFDVNGNLKTTGASGGSSYGQGSTTSGQNVNPSGCAVTTSAPTYTTGQTNMLSCDTTGSVRVNVTSATGVSQASTTAGQTISPIGCRTLTSAPTDTTAQTNMPWCTTKGSLVVAQPTAGDLNVTASPAAATTGGLSTFYLTAANSTNATNIKASAGQVYHVEVYNNSATLAWLSFYNTSGTPTCGTSIVAQTMIPANSTSGAGAVADIALGRAFSSGIGICVTTGIGGTGAVAASSYTITIDYK